MLQLNGKTGGGQMLRTALTLSLITGQAFRMTDIRGGRPKPGLMRQHLTCVRAASAVSEASVEGDEIGSTEIVFRPGKVRGSSYEFAIGTAGSTSLLLQTLLPALSMAGEESFLRLSGGTHNPLAPPFEFLDRVYLPLLRRMGFDATLQLRETGFAPAGGGIVECTIRPAAPLQRFELLERGAHLGSTVRVLVRGLSLQIAGRILDATLAHFPCEDARIHSLPAGPGQGVACLIESEFEHVHELACVLGEMQLPSEALGKRAGRAMTAYHERGAPVGRYLADQLLLPMALGGGGEFLTLTPNDHVPTHLSVIEAFLPVQFRVEQALRGTWKITCEAASC